MKAIGRLAVERRWHPLRVPAEPRTEWILMVRATKPAGWRGCRGGPNGLLPCGLRAPERSLPSLRPPAPRCREPRRAGSMRSSSTHSAMPAVGDQERRTGETVDADGGGERGRYHGVSPPGVAGGGRDSDRVRLRDRWCRRHHGTRPLDYTGVVYSDESRNRIIGRYLDGRRARESTSNAGSPSAESPTSSTNTAHRATC